MTVPRKLLVFAATIVALHLIQEVFLGTSPLGSFLANSLQIFTACAAAVLCFRASRRGTGFTRPFWLLVGCSFLVWSIANMGWIYYETVWHMEPPTDSIFPFLVESRSFFLAMALLLDQKEDTKGFDLASGFDFVQLLIIFTLIYLGWYYLPVLRETHHVALLRASEMEIGEDLVVLGLALVQAKRAQTRPIRSLYLGFTVYFGALTLGAFVTDWKLLIKEIPTGTWLDLLSTIPYLIGACWAATWQPTANFFPTSRPPKSITSMLVNNVIFALAPLIVLLQAAELGPGWRRLSFSLLGVSILCFALRLGLSEFREIRSSLSAHAADRERLEAESKFRVAFHANPEGITISTLKEGILLEVNNAFLATIGYERSELIGRRASELNLWVETGPRNVLIDKLRRGRVSEEEIRVRNKSGEERQLLLSADLIQVQGHECILAIMRDVTEQRLLEKQFQQAQKMEAIGRLAGGVAHDFNNILMITSASTELLLKSREDPARVDHYARQIRTAADRGASLARQLLAFSRQQVLSPSILNLNVVVTELWKMLPRLLGEDVNTALSLDPDLGLVNADRGQLEQVIMNLAVNARDAMPQGGRLTVQTANVTMDGSLPRNHVADVPPGSYVMLAVTDTGVGMTPEILAKVFDPFFTTKELAKGTGLGLSTVYGIVEQSGGHIRVSSAVGSGSTFLIYLPRVEAKTTPATEPQPQNAAAPSGMGTILLVEDETDLREVTCEYLQTKGYEVIEARNGEIALDISMSHKGPIDVLITDVVMPGSSGPAVAKAVAQGRPALRTILISGYTDRSIGPDLLGPNVAFFQKPFSLEELAHKIHSMLHDKRPS